MYELLLIIIAIAGILVASRLVQVRRAALQLERVRVRNNELDSPARVDTLSER